MTHQGQKPITMPRLSDGPHADTYPAGRGTFSAIQWFREFFRLAEETDSAAAGFVHGLRKECQELQSKRLEIMR
jgi:hypothetical protein